MNNSKIKQYKMVFCDIDGTLLNSKNQISKGTQQKIQELYSANIPFILISARMPSGIFPIQSELGIKESIICYNGALILDENRDCIRTSGIECSKALIIDEFIKRNWKQVSCSAYSFDTWMADNVKNKWVVMEQNITSSIPTEGKVSDLFPNERPVHKFLCMGEPEAISSLNRVIKEKFPELSVFRSKDTYLEIMEGKASKSGAITYLCQKYGVSPGDAVSFGDNFNDVDMLLTTGLGFAMGNAPDEVKRQVQNVTLSNDCEGVLAGLAQLSFSKN